MSCIRGDIVVMGRRQGDQPVQEVAPQVVGGEADETAQGPALKYTLLSLI